MPDWVFILTPLLVLPIVLLFRFVGCGSFEAESPPKPPRYRDYIMAEPNNPGPVLHTNVKPSKANVIAYWRLIDPAGVNEAKDEVGNHPGKYPGQYKEGRTIAPELPVGDTSGSEGAPGSFLTGQTGLIVSEEKALCRFFNGAYVLVPYKDGLYTPEFTLEAWIDARWGTTIKNFEHVLFSAGGFYDIPFDTTTDKFQVGFRVFADKDNRWQMQIAPTLANVFKPAPLIPRGAKTHIAVTVQNDVGPKKKVVIYVDGKTAGIGLVDSYLLPDYAPLLIGVGSKNNEPLNDPPPTRPVLSLVQEVVLHRIPLSQEEIENHVDINKK